MHIIVTCVRLRVCMYACVCRVKIGMDVGACVCGMGACVYVLCVVLALVCVLACIYVYVDVGACVYVSIHACLFVFCLLLVG